jgi:Glycosyltransferase family 87
MRRQNDVGVWWANPHVAGILALMPTVLAIFLVIHQLTLHDVLGGVTMQPGSVNFASSVALSRGQFPYTDFVLTQPPGMTILLLPFAWGSHSNPTTALDAARGLTALVAVVDVFLVAFIARFHGLASTMVAGVLFACFPFAFYATSTVTLEPYLLLFCLLAFQAAFVQGQLASGGRLVLAGALIGIALSIKSWAIIPALVLVVCAAFQWRQALVRVLGGLVVGVGVPCIIFVLSSPSAFWRDVVAGELTRGHAPTVAQSLGDRAAEILGLGAPLGISNPSSLALGIGAVVVVLILVAALARASTASTLDWALLATTAGLVAIAFIPHSLPFAYTYFLAGFGAIVIGNSVGTLIGVVAAAGTGAGELSMTAAVGLTALCLAAMVGVVAVGAPTETNYWRNYFIANNTNPTAAIQSLVPSGSCVISNNADSLIVTDRFTLPVGCPYVVDPSGIDRVAGSLPASNAQWEQLLSEARYVVIAPGTPRILATPQLQGYLARNFTLIQHSNYQVFQANGRAAA